MRERPDPWRRVPEGRAFAANLAMLYAEALDARTPGGVRVICELAESAPDCLMLLRRLGIRGDGLWVAYKRIAGEDALVLATELRIHGPAVAARVAEILARPAGG